MNTLIETQEKLVFALAKEVTGKWDAIKIHYEYILLNGIQFEKYIAQKLVSGSVIDINLSLDMIDCFIELNEITPEGQSEKWSWLEFTLESSGKYYFDYKYGIPPLVSESIKSA